MSQGLEDAILFAGIIAGMLCVYAAVLWLMFHVVLPSWGGS